MRLTTKSKETTSATELLWVIWRCLSEIRKRKKEKYHSALLRAIHFFKNWMSINAEREWFDNNNNDNNNDSNNNDNNKEVQNNNNNNDSGVNSNNGNNSNNNNNNINWQTYMDRTDQSILITQFGEVLNLYNHILFHQEYSRFLNWIGEPKRVEILHRNYHLASEAFYKSTFIACMPTLKPNDEKRNDFSYADASAKMLRQLLDKSYVDQIVQQFQLFTFSIARQLRASDMICSKQFRYHSKSIDPSNSNSILELIHFFNRCHQSILNFILFLQNDSDRMKAAKGWLKLAEKLSNHAVPNYFVVQLILSSFSSVSISRLHTFRDNPAIQATLKHFTQNPDRSFAAYRDVIKGQQCIFPLLSVPITDITFIQDGSPNNRALVKLTHISVAVEGVISPIRASISHLDFSSPIDFSFLESLLQFSFLYNEYEAYERSKEIQPRRPSNF